MEGRPTALQLQKIRDQAVPFRRRPERKGKHANVFRKIVLSVLNVDDETILFSCRCRVPLVIDYKRKLCSCQINSLGSERLHWSNGMQLRPLDSIGLHVLGGNGQLMNSLRTYITVQSLDLITVQFCESEVSF